MMPARGHKQAGWQVYYDQSCGLLRLAPCTRERGWRARSWFQTETIALKVLHWRKAWLKDMKRWGKNASD